MNVQNDNKIINNLAKVIRVITIPPIMAIVFLISLFLFKETMFNNLYELFISIFTIAIIPVLAYPIQNRFNVFKGKCQRTNQRNLAVIFSVIGYSLGLLCALITKAPGEQLIVYITYLFSGLLIFIGTFILKIKFSGHMAGISGPVISLAYFLNYYLLFLYVLLMIVFWASIRTKRHTIVELLTGSIVPVMSFFLALLIIL